MSTWPSGTKASGTPVDAGTDGSTSDFTMTGSVTDSSNEPVST